MPTLIELDLERLGALACILLGVVFFLRAGIIIWKDWSLHRTGELTQGRVVRVIDEHESDKLVIAFTDGRGRRHEFTTDLSQSSGSYPVGTAVKVRYDPARPGRAHLAGQPVSRAAACFFLLLSGAIVGFVGVMMWRAT